MLPTRLSAVFSIEGTSSLSRHSICASAQVRRWLALDVEELRAFVRQGAASQAPEAARQLAVEGILECFAMARCAVALMSAAQL